MWWDFIKPYLRGDKTYRCPALLDSKSVNVGAGLNNRIWGYGITAPHVFTEAKSATMASIPRSSKTMLICDGYTMDVDANGNLVESGIPVVYCRCTGNYLDQQGKVTRHGYTYHDQYM